MVVCVWSTHTTILTWVENSKHNNKERFDETYNLEKPWNYKYNILKLRNQIKT